MAMKCCTKLETAKERCPIVFQGNPSNFKFTQDKTSPILTQIGRFQTIGRSQLSNPSDLPCYCNKNVMAFDDTIYDDKSHFDLYTLQPSWVLCLAFLPINVSIIVTFRILNHEDNCSLIVCRKLWDRVKVLLRALCSDKVLSTNLICFGITMSCHIIFILRSSSYQI